MSGRPNVILVVLDTVRADRISGLGYGRETTPNLDAFLDAATTFTDAVAHGPWSVPSHASLLTGEYPSEHGATITAPILTHGPTLPELLSAAGYGTYGFSANEYVRPATGFARGFDEFHTPGPTEPAALADLLAPVVHRITGTAGVRRPIDRALDLLREREALSTDPRQPADDGLLETVTDVVGRAEDPFFLFANLIDAHLPRSPDPGHVDSFVDADLAETPVVTNERAKTLGGAEMDERGFRKLSQLYDADLRTMDDRFGALLDRLRAAGVLSDSLVVVVSDHGEHLGEFGLVGHQFSVFDSAVSVPLAVRFPGGGPETVDDQVETRRVFHTVLDETGVRSCGDRSLASGVGDGVARGSYRSPMVDIPALVADDEVRYDRELLGEPLAFARTGNSKLIEFDGDSWLFDVPESGQPPVSRSDAPGRYEELAARL
jgi:arylsulfatase A-like enzyme